MNSPTVVEPSKPKTCVIENKNINEMKTSMNVLLFGVE